MTEQSGWDMAELLRQAQLVQDQLLKAKQDASAVLIEGVSASGAVKVVVSGDFDFKSVHIDESLKTLEDPSMLEDLILVAIRDAVNKANEVNQQALGSINLSESTPLSLEISDFDKDF